MTPRTAARHDRIAALQAQVAELHARNDALEAESTADTSDAGTEPHTIAEDALGVTLSTRFQSEPVIVTTDHTAATIQVQRDHDHVRLAAIEATDRTVEAVLRGSPAAMTALADRLYAAATQATTDATGGADDG